MNKAILAFTMAGSLVGCAADETPAGRSAARLSEVEKILTSGGTTTIERLELRYDDSELAQVNGFRNGAPNGTARLTYFADKLQRIDFADKDGDRAFTRLEYVDGYLWKTHNEVTGAITLDRTVWYDEQTAMVKELSYARSSPGTTTHNWVTRYEYDPQSRVKQLVDVDEGVMQTSELRYTAEGLVERMSVYTGSQHEETWDFRYLDGRLDEITDTHNRSVSVFYGADDLIEEIRVLDGSTNETYRYTYEPGTVKGMTFSPDIPVAGQFDLRGKSYDDLALLHLPPPIQEEVPHVTTGDVCVADDGSSCSACLNNFCCESCTTSTCGSYVDCAATCNGSASCLSSCAASYPGNAAFGQCATNNCSASCAL